MNDEQLMQAYVKGDEAAFSQLFRRHRSKVYAYVLRRVQNEAAAEELLQEIFLKFHNSRSTYKKQFLVAQWIYVITKTVLADHVRKKGREIELANSDEWMQVAAPEPADKKLNLTGISTTEQKVLRLRFEEDKDFDEIAKALNKSEVNVRKILSRGLQNLRRKIGSGK